MTGRNAGGSIGRQPHDVIPRTVNARGDCMISHTVAPFVVSSHSVGCQWPTPQPSPPPLRNGRLRPIWRVLAYTDGHWDIFAHQPQSAAGIGRIRHTAAISPRAAQPTLATPFPFHQLSPPPVCRPCHHQRAGNGILAVADGGMCGLAVRLRQRRPKRPKMAFPKKDATGASIPPVPRRVRFAVGIVDAAVSVQGKDPFCLLRFFRIIPAARPIRIWRFSPNPRSARTSPRHLSPPAF